LLLEGKIQQDHIGLHPVNDRNEISRGDFLINQADGILVGKGTAGGIDDCLVF